MTYTDFINRQIDRKTTILTTIGSLSCVGAIFAACAVRYPVTDSPLAWIVSCVLWATTAVCALSCIRLHTCIRLHSRRAKRKSRDSKCLGYIRIDQDGGFYYDV